MFSDEKIERQQYYCIYVVRGSRPNDQNGQQTQSLDGSIERTFRTLDRNLIDILMTQIDSRFKGVGYHLATNDRITANKYDIRLIEK